MDGSVEASSHFQPKYIKSHFTHIYAVVCYQVFYLLVDLLVESNFKLLKHSVILSFLLFWYFRRKAILIIYRSYQMIVFHCLGHFLQLRQNLRTMTTSFDFFSSNWLMEKKRRKHIMTTLLHIYMFKGFIFMCVYVHKV